MRLLGIRLPTTLRLFFFALLMFVAARGAHAQISLSATAVSGSQINLSWNPQGLDWIYVMRNSGTWEILAFIPGSSTSYSDGGLPNGTTYTYFLHAITYVEYGSYDDYSNTVSATTLSLPAAPSGLGASAVSGTQINLSWTDGSGNETGFKIERKTGAGGTYNEITTVGADVTSYSNTGVSNGTTYYYRVRAANSVGDSGYTNETSATTPEPPSAPSGLSATPGSGLQANLSWTDTSGNETGFLVERKTGAGGTYSQIASLGANVTSYADSGFSAGTYYYRVWATNATGNSGYSNEANASFVLPNAPSGLTAADLSSGKIGLGWADNSDGETGFKVERKTGATGTYAQIATPAANAVSYEDAGVSSGITYYYRIRATSNTGDSAYSNEVSVLATMPNITTGTVTYTYDHFGNLLTTNAGGVTTTLTYDIRGRKLTMADPDMGSWSYAYNALGELVSQTDAKNQVTTMAYDLLGRMTTRTEPDLVSTWTYDACTKGVGKLCSVSATNDYARTYTYDSLGRVSGVNITVDSSYSVTTAYDSSGRVDTLTYPTGFVAKHVYNSYGYLQKVQDTAGTPTVFWQANAQNAAGQVTGETLGNGLTVSRSYDALFRLTAASATDGTLTPHSQSFAYDPIGNVIQRVDVTQGVTENLAYDTLNRLTQTSGSGLTTRIFDYNSIGNITYKSDVGSYGYPGTTAAQPHAVASVTRADGFPGVTASYTYDANGSLTAASGTIYPATGSVSFSRTLTYTSFNMPSALSHTQGSATYSYTYTYSAEHERVRLVTVRPSDTLTSIYIHPAGKGALLYEKETRASDSVIEHKHYVNGGSGLIGVYVTKSSYGTGEGPEMRYYHKDHLGSIAAITNPSGAVIERLAYEAFGERRYPSGAPEDRSSPLIGVTTDRGFTAHEHLDEMMLIHMNGRIYDPVLARFMTADPFVQGVTNLQSYNRYSYVNNNPLAYTDPSGYFKLKSLFKAAAVVAIAIYAPQFIESAFVSSATSSFIAGTGGLSTVFVTLGGEAATLTGLGSFAAGAAGGFGAAFIASNGSLDASLRAGLTGGLSGLLAGYYGAGYSLERVGAESVLSGFNARLQGRPFAEGFRRGLAFSGLTYGNYLMRQEMIANSRLDPSNLGKDSDGFFGDGIGLAGSRQTVDPGGEVYLPCVAPMGGCQGAPNLANGDDASRFFSFNYGRGSVWDRINEAFAGPHDWFRNLTGAYNEFGNNSYLTGFRLTADSVMNYGLVLPAAPFAGAALLSWPRSAFNSLTVKKH